MRKNVKSGQPSRHEAEYWERGFYIPVRVSWRRHGKIVCMRIGFILGAGVSLPAGMPSTAALTDEVLRVENYSLHFDGSFARPEIVSPPFLADGPPSSESVPGIRA